MKYALLTLLLAGTFSLSFAQQDEPNTDLSGDISVMAWDVAAEALANLVPSF